MSRYIDADALMKRFAEMQKVRTDKDGREYACNFRNMGGEPSAEWFTVEYVVENAPTVDAVPVVRCRECIHRPKMPDNYIDGFDLEFPDHKCPCRCEDGFYSWYPADNWFCADGERRTDEQQSKG